MKSILRGMARRKSFTFIELVVAVALSIVLLRAMYVIFDAATGLARACIERQCIMLEASAIFDQISGDLERTSRSRILYFNVSSDGQTFVFLVPRDAGLSTPYAYIEYSFDKAPGADYGTITRSVYSQPDCSPATALDENGDGAPDVDIVIGRRVRSFDAQHHVSGGLDGEWARGITCFTRAIKCVVRQGGMTNDGVVPDETFDMTIPIMVESEILFFDDFDYSQESQLSALWEITKTGTASISFQQSEIDLSTGTSNSRVSIMTRPGWKPSDYGQLTLECGMKATIPGTPTDWGTNQFCCLTSLYPHALPQRIGFLFDDISDDACDSVTVDATTLTQKSTEHNMRDRFHVYKWVATQSKVDFYIDGQLVKTHTTNIPWDTRMQLLFVTVNGNYSEDHHMQVQYVKLTSP